MKYMYSNKNISNSNKLITVNVTIGDKNVNYNPGKIFEKLEISWPINQNEELVGELKKYLTNDYASIELKCDLLEPSDVQFLSEAYNGTDIDESNASLIDFSSTKFDQNYKSHVYNYFSDFIDNKALELNVKSYNLRKNILDRGALVKSSLDKKLYARDGIYTRDIILGLIIGMGLNYDEAVKLMDIAGYRFPMHIEEQYVATLIQNNKILPFPEVSTLYTDEYVLADEINEILDENRESNDLKLHIGNRINKKSSE